MSVGFLIKSLEWFMSQDSLEIEHPWASSGSKMPPPAPGTGKNLTRDFWVMTSVPVTSDERFTELITRVLASGSSLLWHFVSFYSVFYEHI